MMDGYSGKPGLERDENGLYLTDGELMLRVDFCEMKDRIRQANLERELLVKAAAVKGFKDRLKVLDATAGLGEDSFLLAAAGFEVYMYEQDEVIAALLDDGIRRAQDTDDPDIPEEIRIAAERLHFSKGDSISAMHTLAQDRTSGSEPRTDTLAQGKTFGSENGTDTPETPNDNITEDFFDVIYLDPMFPERKKSAAVKKKFQLLQQLERPEMREKELFDAAVSLKPRKVVIKRPIKGPFLCGIKPEYSVKGNSVRYDVVIPRG